MEEGRRARLELLRIAGAGGDGEGRGDVVAEGREVGVLLHRHELDRVVAQRRDARQHVVCARGLQVGRLCSASAAELGRDRSPHPKQCLSGGGLPGGRVLKPLLSRRAEPATPHP